MDMHAATLSEACLAKLRIIWKLTSLEFQPLQDQVQIMLSARLLRGCKTVEPDSIHGQALSRACKKAYSVPFVKAMSYCVLDLSHG